jgi:hypothetical protein
MSQLFHRGGDSDAVTSRAHFHSHSQLVFRRNDYEYPQVPIRKWSASVQRSFGLLRTSTHSLSTIRPQLTIVQRVIIRSLTVRNHRLLVPVPGVL